MVLIYSRRSGVTGQTDSVFVSFAYNSGLVILMRGPDSHRSCFCCSFRSVTNCSEHLYSASGSGRVLLRHMSEMIMYGARATARTNALQPEAASRYADAHILLASSVVTIVPQQVSAVGQRRCLVGVLHL